MQINGAVALVTGANRGLGEQFVKALLDRGAAKVYAAARNPDAVRVPGAVPLALDITNPASVRAAAERAQDVNLLVNNAGISTGSGVLDGSLEDYRREMDTHVFGTLDVSRAFAPVLGRNGGGALLNVLSVLSWLAVPRTAAYCAAKAAEWSVTNSLRISLAEQRTQVTALHVGLMDTDLAAGQEGPKSDPAEVARAALDGIEAGAYEVLADEMSRQVKAALSGDPAALYPRPGSGV
ncbi:SDR family oxidoreductase [Kitasatospora sp. GP82]|uniref:SDR family oxidoreductase n=1 Tax=Kitasatospora sp. GP82 TaxID=3035089 RepID=UPI0024743BA3|nr:SDR family oxidoreductase [Kitasatospora sp. GP82]MDH6126516.1 NAD(P)-dependent dehydrogenase (short-subunit alcohol dehydrogenase family) [Kitasatospora sp. GP82]